MDGTNAVLTGKAAFLPTPEQQFLLNACLFDGEEAIASWRSWRNTIDFGRIDMGSIRLLPLLSENLKRLGIDDSSFGAYRGIQRRTWAHNQLLFRGAARLADHLQRAGVSSVALKGIVLASTCYAGISLRPMGDLDFLVKRADCSRALDELERLGWRPQGGKWPREAADFAIRHSCAFEDAANPEVSVDLHWRLFWAHRNDDAEAILWQRAMPFNIGSIQVLAPCAADMLVHICAHGAKWNYLSPIRWVADAVFLLRGSRIDWEHFRAQSARLRLDLQLADTLGYLRNVMGAPVPDEILRDLGTSKARPIEHLIYNTELYPPEKRSLQTALRIHWHVARLQLARSSGIYGYWRYFAALRAGRSFGEITAWIRKRVAGGLN
jgi:Uncharacterised nucleotidyltransferase